MRTISAKFLTPVIAFAAIFSGLILYGTWSSSRSQIEQLIQQEAELALEFDLAIRAHVAEEIRPLMLERVEEGQFFPEAMSTSNVARSVFDRVQEVFPDYIIKFSSVNPRNPANLAGPEEQEIIQHFKEHPDAKRWTGKVTMGGREYLAHFSVRRIGESCLVCHGRPEDAPAALVARYGRTAGFGWAVGDVSMDTIAIPLDSVNSAFASQTAKHVLVTGGLLAALTGFVVLVFRHTVTRRLAAITGHFQREALKTEDGSVLESISVKGDDEIGIMAAAFNRLVERLRNVHESLEERVRQRTAELENEVDERKKVQQEREAQLRRIQEYSSAVVSLATHPAIADGDLQTAARALNEVVAAAMNVARAGVWLLRKGNTELECVDLLETGSGEHAAGTKLNAEDYPSYFEAFKTQRAVDAHDALTDPRTSEFAENYLKPLGITSMLDAAIRVSGQVVGVVCIEHVGAQRAWLAEDVTFAGEAADQMAQALLNSDRKQALEERRELEAKLQHAQKLESLGVLAGGIAHDFNNLLMAILGNTELALSELADTSPVCEHLRDIEGASRHAADLCRQMLAYSGRGLFEMTAIDLSELVDEIMRLLKTSVSKKVTLNLHLDRGLPSITADPAQVRQIIMNLVTNASEAIGDGMGSIDVTTGGGRFSARQLTPNLTGEELAEGEYAFVEITDSGSGMDDEMCRKIFDPFFSTKFTGRGLGLAAVLGIVRAHRGQLILSSRPGHGTMFVVRFPVTPKREARLEEPQRAPESGTNGGIVLLVDDEEVVRTVVERMLQKAGFDVVLADDGQQALELFRSHMDSIDCVVLDMTMPRMSGEEAFEEMKKLKEDLPVVFVSGYEDPGIVERCPNGNLVRFLQKPYRTAELVACIREVLGSES